jgi:hypothetical protein
LSDGACCHYCRRYRCICPVEEEPSMPIRKHFLQRVKAPSGKIHAVKGSRDDQQFTLCGPTLSSETTLPPETKVTCRRCLRSLAASWDLK